jgi:hypothetical protein
MNQKYLWAALAIAAMWIAVAVVGAAGSDFVNESVTGDRTEIPAVWAVAVFAAIATAFVAVWGFRE